MQTQPPAAEANSSGRHEHNLAAVLFQFGNRLRDRRKMLDVELAVAPGHNAGAELDHCTPRRAQPLLLLALWILIFHGPLLYH
jgi:hypothetical protein